MRPLALALALLAASSGCLTDGNQQQRIQMMRDGMSVPTTSKDLTIRCRSWRNWYGQVHAECD